MKSIKLANFKRFVELELELRPLTVLTGANGTGKSSILQALTLIRQASRLGYVEADSIALNDLDGLQLGEALDVLARGANESVIEVQLTLEESALVWRFRVKEERAMVLGIEQHPPSVPNPIGGLPTRCFTYLCAERLGPRNNSRVSSDEPSVVGVGPKGEYTAQVLHELQRELVSEGRCLSAAVSPMLLHQVEGWLSDIVSPIQIKPKWPTGLNVAQIRYKTPSLRSEWTSAPNMGFGVSYALPVVVGGLLVPPGGVFLVENPEAHLHPAGQSRMGVFLGRLATDGVQVIVETHSDHVINGIRRAATGETSLSHEHVLIHYFIDDVGSEQVATIELQKSGSLTSWPKGFFDQMDQDLAILARVRRAARDAI